MKKYLEKCLNSLVNQTLKDIEIIVVNDGTLDNSQNIIDKYVKKYKNVVGYKKKNGGLSDARNYGLKYACGEYVAFVDSDDYVELDMFEKMYNKAFSNKFDVVCCDFDKIEFKKGVWFEDVEFMYRLFPYIKSIGIIKESLYHYVQREGAITKTFDDRLYHYVDNWNGIVTFYKERNFYDEYFKELEYCYVRYLYATFVKQATNYSEKDKYKSAVKVAITNVEKMFPNYRRNKYFYKSLKGIYLVLFNRLLADIYYSLRRKK